MNNLTYNPSNILSRVQLVETLHETKYVPALENIGVIFPNLQNCTFCKKYLKNNKYNKLN